MPTWFIKRSNWSARKTRVAFCFLNRQREPYEWMDKEPEDDSEFQGLLKEEEVARYSTSTQSCQE
jgi:hypothetical protein